MIDEAQPRPITVRIREACRITGIGRSKLYELIAAGEIEIIKIGSMTLVPMDALEAFIGSQRQTRCWRVCRTIPKVCFWTASADGCRAFSCRR